MGRTTSGVQRVFLIGGDAELSATVSAACDREVILELAADLTAGDMVIIDARGCTPLDTGNAFATCRAIKEDSSVGVFLLIAEDDPYSREIARFCMANGCIVRAKNGELSGLEGLAGGLGQDATKVPLDALLDRLEGDLERNADRGEAVLRRMVDDDQRDHLLDLLTDAETGLYDGPFATFKLDEEYKRAIRFHQPLSLILLDCGIENWPRDGADRSTVLAEVASIFLNECRDIDTLARFTESEFLFLLPGTGMDGATAVAHRMLQELRSHRYSVAVELRPMAGLVTVPASGISDKRAFLREAESCLAAARSGAGQEGLCASSE